MEKIHKETLAKNGFSSGKILLPLLSLALAIRILFAFAHPGLINDEMIYLRMAQNLNQGNGLADQFGAPATIFFPLLPILIAGVARVLQNYIVSGYLVMAVFGTLVLIPVYLLGKQLASEKIGLYAAALAAVFPALVYYSSRIFTEAVYTFFLLMAVYNVWQMLKHPRLKYAAIGGVSLGLAYLSNPGAVFYLVTFAGLTMIVAFKKGMWRNLAGPLGLLVLIFMIIAAPYVLFLHAHLDRWTYSGKNAAANIGANVDDTGLYTFEWSKKYQALTEDGQDVVVNRLMMENSDPVSEVVRQPVRTAKIFISNVNKFYSEKLNYLFPVWLFLLAGLGLFKQGWDRQGLARNGFIALMMSPALFILAIDTRVRFFVPFTAMSLIWVAQGWEKLEKWSTETFSLVFGSDKNVWFRILPWLVGVMILLPLLSFSVGKFFLSNYALGVKEAGEWIKQEAGPGKHIMAGGGGQAYYYADGVPVSLPYADYNQATKFARLKDVDFLVVRKSSIVPDNSPLLLKLLGDEASHPDWRLVNRVRPDTEHETLIFALKK